METSPDQDADQSIPRKRVSQACKPCGIKKVKCDGALPSCSLCQSRGVECEYGESRRKNRNEPARDGTFTPPNHYSTHTNNSNHKTLAVPAQLSTRLIKTYFNQIHPLWPILYKPLYATLDYSNPTHMMSPALVLAIYAIASCIEPSDPFNPGTFFNEAMQYRHTPTISNCQALTILALQQHGVAEYARAAMLCGLASAIAFELRLHRPDGSKDEIQGEIRLRLWWNLYILEKMMSCEMGRPVLLRAEETDCGIPSVSEADEFELMTTFNRDGSSRNTSIKLRTISGLHTSIRLSIIMERICREIYGVSARKSIRADQQYGEAKRLELWNDLQAWEKSMAKSPLRLDLSDELTSVPTAITNFVVMWSATILLHRPFIGNGNSDPSEKCFRAANEICFILEKYFDRLPGLPCDMVFSVFTAASTFLHHSKQHETDDGFETRRKLKLCIHWLSVWGKSWKTAGARHKLLDDIYDLPSDLKPGGQSLVPLLKQFTPPPPPGPTPFTAINGSSQQIPQPQPKVDDLVDWSFLKEFGDPTDEFFALDVDLRSLLEQDFASGSNRFI